MLDSLSFRLFTGSLVLLATLYFRLANGISYKGGIPRAGKPGVFGYISTAFKSLVNSEALLKEAREQYPDRAFVIPTFSRLLFCLPSQHLDAIRSASDSQFNQPIAVQDSLQLAQTMNKHQLENPYQATVCRTDVNRALPAFIPELLDEGALAIDETFKPLPGEDSVELPVFHTLTHLIARISNRVMVGLDLCRNEEYLHAVVRFAETVTLLAGVLGWFPPILRPAAYRVISRFTGGKEGALKFMVPFVKDYVERRKAMDEKPALVVEFLAKSAPPHETVEGLAMRVLNLNFGSIHTSSLFTSQALFELAVLPKSDTDGIRREILDALESEGGEWNKDTLLKCRKVDSVLKEVGRMYGISTLGIPRISMLGYDLGDGTFVPPGSSITFSLHPVHRDPKLYPDPERCDLLRFYKLWEADKHESKYNFSSIDTTYLPFGIGRHACAGRQFASTELKLMLAHIILNYDISLPPGVTERAKNLSINSAVIPDPKAKLVFTRRQTKVMGS